MPATFDLIYVDGSEGRTMSCAIVDGEDVELIGPFPAKEAGPAIVEALASHASLGFADKGQAEIAYAFAHFRNRARGENDAGQAYPFRI